MSPDIYGLIGILSLIGIVAVLQALFQKWDDYTTPEPEADEL